MEEFLKDHREEDMSEGPVLLIPLLIDPSNRIMFNNSKYLKQNIDLKIRVQTFRLITC